MNNIISRVLVDLHKHIMDEEKTDDISEPSRYKYDRMSWTKSNISGRDNPYEVGLESLRVLIYQLGLFQKHIFTKDGRELEQIITEK